MRNPHVRSASRLRPRVAVVTGAGSGPGREVALRLASRGLAVACADLDQDAVDATARLVARHRVPCSAQVVDPSDEAAVARWRRRVVDGLGSPLVLVHSGPAGRRTAAGGSPVDRFMDSLRSSLGGSYVTATTFLPAMVEAGWGRVVTIAPVVAVEEDAGHAAARAGIADLAKSLHLGLRATGVTINAVCPVGATGSSCGPRSAARASTSAAADHRAVADAVAFLCGSDAAGISGVAITVDVGGSEVLAASAGAGG